MAILILFHGIVNWWYFDGVSGNLKTVGRWWSRRRQLLNRGTGVPLQRLFGDKYLKSFFSWYLRQKKSSSWLCLSSSSWSSTHHKLHFCSPCVIAGFARPPVWGPDVAPVPSSSHHHNFDWFQSSSWSYHSLSRLWMKTCICYEWYLFCLKTCRSMSKYSRRSHSTSFRSWPGWWWWWWWWWVGGWGGRWRGWK